VEALGKQEGPKSFTSLRNPRSFSNTPICRRPTSATMVVLDRKKPFRFHHVTARYRVWRTGRYEASTVRMISSFSDAEYLIPRTPHPLPELPPEFRTLT